MAEWSTAEPFCYRQYVSIYCIILQRFVLLYLSKQMLKRSHTSLVRLEISTLTAKRVTQPSSLSKNSISFLKEGKTPHMHLSGLNLCNAMLA